MGFYGWTYIRAYSENEDSLNSITPEKLVQIAEDNVKPGSEPWVYKVSKETAGEIELRKPGLCKLCAGNKNGFYSMNAVALSMRIPDVIFVSHSANDCTDETYEYMCLNGKKKYIYSFMMPKSSDLDNISFAQVKAIFDFHPSDDEGLILLIENDDDEVFLEDPGV